MAEAVVSFVMESLGNLLIEEVKLLHGVGGKVQQIRDELRMMQAFLRDADARQNEEERIREWVAEIKSLAYDAGDVLESYILGVESKRKGGLKIILERYVCILNECIVGHKVGSKIEDIRTAISALTTRLQAYGIRSLSEGQEGSSSADEVRSQLRRSYSHVDEDDFIALEGEVEHLAALLVNDQEGDKYYGVVSVYGMGGLGKTTIAKKVYKHARVKSHFAAFAWVCVSQQWQTKDILQKILKNLMPEVGDTVSKLDVEELSKKISELQQNKKCLVVLDDIWSIDAWDCLRLAFPSIGKMGGKLLLTSRNVDVATHVDPQGFLYQPRLLVEGECWELFQKKAFNGRVRNGDTDVKEMEKLGSEMLKHCGGLPLAVIVLGGLLATKHSLREWQMVHQSIRSYLRKGEGVGRHFGGVSDILALSYNDLPYQLKPCFLYLAQFLEDSKIEVERLYQLWIAESMVLSKDRREGETMMNVAECYLSELAQRCMVQVELEEEESRFRRYKSCNLHDLMRDLCTIKAKEEDFFRAVGLGVGNDHDLGDSSSSSAISNRTRRLVICYDDKDTRSRHFSLDKKTSQHLRSLLFLNPLEEKTGRMRRIIRYHLKDFKLLRVLDIDRLDLDLSGNSMTWVLDHRTIPKAIGNLIHLRYLSLRRTVFLSFPTFLTNLKHLQTLNLKSCFFFFFYHQCMRNMLRKMGRLRHLYLPDAPLFHSKTTKLRLGDLCNLEVLQNFDPSWCDAEDLIKLTNLRKLTAYVSEKLEDLERIVDYLIRIAHHIQHSSLFINFDFRSEKGYIVLRQLLGCHNLHQLSISGCLGNKLPPNDHDHHFNFSSSLTKLSLYNSDLQEDPMPSLENIPNLRVLSLYHSFGGKEMVCSAMGFSQLISLRLTSLSELEEWRLDKGSMPKLSHLEIFDCTKLVMVPDGLRFVTTLRELKITRMPEAFNNRVRVVDGEEGEDFYKIRHVPSIII